MAQELVFVGSPRTESDHASHWTACYYAWLDAQRSDRTREDYAAWVQKFVVFVGKFPDEITGADGQTWVSWLKEHGGRDGKGHKEASVNAAVAAVSSFFKYAAHYEFRPRQYLSTFNPMDSVKRPRVNRYEHARWLSAEQVIKLLNSCTYEDVIESRDYAILLWYLFTARRRDELLTIRWGDIQDGQRAAAKVYRFRGKGNKVKWKTLPPPVWQATVRYLQLSQRLETMTPRSPLFVPTNTNASRPSGKRDPREPGKARKVVAYDARAAAAGEQSVASRTLYEIVTRAVRRAGLPNVGVHGLRHTAARMRRRLGISVLDLQEFLGHEHIDTTMIYVKETEAQEDEGWEEVAVLLGLQKKNQGDASTPVTPVVWEDETAVLAARFMAEDPSKDEVVQAGLQVLSLLVDGQSTTARWDEADRAELLERFQQAIHTRLAGSPWPGEEEDDGEGVDAREAFDGDAWLGQ